jgi:hypothetical protein
MRTPSRLMKPIPDRRAGFWTYAVLTIIFACLLWASPYLITALIVAVGLLYINGAKRHRRKMAALAAAHPAENGICSFARSFDLYQTDSWVVRAVYEELQDYFANLNLRIRIKAEDDLFEDLDIDPDDLDASAIDAATRAGRSTRNWEVNPYYGRVRTVRDLVMFLDAQPRVA